MAGWRSWYSAPLVDVKADPDEVRGSIPAIRGFLKSVAKRWTRRADGRHRRIPSVPPDGIFAFSPLQAATAAAAVAESTGQQQDYDDDEEDCEHVHLPSLSWVGSCMARSASCFSCGR
jgi:hypothetical protein